MELKEAIDTCRSVRNYTSEIIKENCSSIA